jgi:hypothetical protein
MLVSTIITNGLLLSDIPNTSFYTAAESLFAVQLAWEQMYSFLASNNDDYFVTPLYLNRSVSFTGDTGIGSAVVTNIPSTFKLLPGMTITDSSSTFAANTYIVSVDTATQVTLSANAAASITGDNFTSIVFVPDTNRNYVSLIDTTSKIFADGFYRLRLIQYQGYSGTTDFYPASKMTIENFGNTQNTPAYRFEGKYLAIYDPSNYSPYCIWYYPRPATLITTTDLSYPYNMIPEIMAYQLAVEIRRKQKQPVDLWQARIAELSSAMAQQMSRDDSHGEAPKNQFGQGFAPYI